jgi:hypothetical protein
LGHRSRESAGRALYRALIDQPAPSSVIGLSP